MEHLLTDEYDQQLHDEPYAPAPLITAFILFLGAVITGLAIWKLCELAAAAWRAIGG